MTADPFFNSRRNAIIKRRRGLIGQRSTNGANSRKLADVMSLLAQSCGGLQRRCWQLRRAHFCGKLAHSCNSAYCATRDNPRLKPVINYKTADDLSLDIPLSRWMFGDNLTSQKQKQ